MVDLSILDQSAKKRWQRSLPFMHDHGRSEILHLISHGIPLSLSRHAWLARDVMNRLLVS